MIFRKRNEDPEFCQTSLTQGTTDSTRNNQETNSYLGLGTVFGEQDNMLAHVTKPAICIGEALHTFLKASMADFECSKRIGIFLPLIICYLKSSEIVSGDVVFSYHLKS